MRDWGWRDSGTSGKRICALVGEGDSKRVRPRWGKTRNFSKWRQWSNGDFIFKKKESEE